MDWLCGGCCSSRGANKTSQSAYEAGRRTSVSDSAVTSDASHPSTSYHQATSGGATTSIHTVGSNYDTCSDHSDGRVKRDTTAKTTGTNKHNNNLPPEGKVLSRFTLDAIAELFSGTETREKIPNESVIVLVGAGMSTKAGIPDFRSPSSGIYANLQKYNLPHPEDIFKIDYFKNNPTPFYDLSRSLLPVQLKPTLSHYFVRLLHEKGFLLRCFSQNVDSLESLSGLPKERLCLAHGSFETSHCLRCNAEYPLAWVRRIVERGEVPHCTQTKDCKGLIKPDIKFFGERLDGRFFRLVKQDFPKCQLLIIIGSSLTVAPFAQLIERVPEQCPRLLINKDKIGRDLPAIFRLFKPSSGLLYDSKYNIRDVAVIGDCDETCMSLRTCSIGPAI